MFNTRLVLSNKMVSIPMETKTDVAPVHVGDYSYCPHCNTELDVDGYDDGRAYRVDYTCNGCDYQYGDFA